MLEAKKKRRKNQEQQDSPGPPTSMPQQTSGPAQADELPDFDLDEEGGGETRSSQSMKLQKEQDDISPAMMGTIGKPVRSVRELLSDRSLESKLKFDEAEDQEALPDLVQLASSVSATSTAQPGKKRARQEARRSAAQAAAAQEEKEENVFLSKLEYIKNEKGEIDGVKILEAGTWLGIFLLVAWEVYINVFMDRAAPIIPVVY
jgi:hypothetical protein